VGGSVRSAPIPSPAETPGYFSLRELPEPDYEYLKKKDPGFCPFCPDNIPKITPKFNPALFGSDRYRVGEAVCFPNAFPYDENGAVTVMTEKHFVPIDELTEKIIKDAISCCIEFLADVSSGQPEAVYQSINWNYLPDAGSSILHPHLQITASSIPTNYYSDVVKNIAVKGGDLFVRLVSEEQRLNERFLSRKEFFSWMLAFAPEGVFDVMAISHEYFKPSDLSGARLDELVNGICKSIKFISSKRIISYNMSLFFLLGNMHFIPHMRLCPRTTVPPLDTCEINYMKMLHNEPMSTMKPEMVAEEFRKYWL
jgi:galactose-1-phosphate uridylyltransferase